MILLGAGIIIYLLKSLDLLYLFQTKEYRLDRILNFLKEDNLLSILYFRKIRMPAITLRNILIAQGFFFNLIPIYLIFKNLNSLLLLIFIIFSPIVALLTMFLGIILSEIPVQLYRKIIIYQAKQMVKNSTAVFIGITGSYGKTSTKEFLFQILSQKYKVGKTQENYNSDIGVALSILKNLKPDTQYFITEIGAYRKGEIRSICQFINPKFGILTAVGNQHLSLFGSKKNLIDAKSELLESLPVDGIAYINKDIKEWKYFSQKTKAKIVYFSLSDIPTDIKINLLGVHNLQNLLPCIILASDLGIEKSIILKAVKNLRTLKGKLSFEKGINRSTILNDSYSSNVEGFLAALNTASKMNFKKKYVISPGLIELGTEKTPSYQKIIEVVNNYDLTLLTIDRLFKRLDSKNKVVDFHSENKLVDYIKEKADKNTLIVIEGRFERKTITSLVAHS